MPLSLVSAVGFVVLTGLACLCSGNRRVIAWRTVTWGIGLQLLIGFLIFRLIGLMMDERAEGGFVFIDEPFAHLDVLNIDRVAQFLEATRAQYIITSPNTHNINIYRPASLSIVTHKKRAGEPFAAIPTHLRRQR